MHNIQSGKARNYGLTSADDLTVFEYDIDSDPAELEIYCKNADFVFNLAGVNRPKDQTEFMKGNFGFASTLLDTLKNTKYVSGHDFIVHTGSFAQSVWRIQKSR